MADNLIWITLAVVSGGLLLWPSVRTRLAGPALSTLEVTQLINRKNAQVIDVRDTAAFATGSLPGAKNLPADAVQARSSELKKDRPVVLIDERGAQAGRVATALRAAGFEQVFILAGGLAAWRAAGLPTRT